MPIVTLLSTIPSNLTLNIIKEFNDLHEQYYLGKWRVSELSGGRFGEAVLRILEYKCNGSFTALGTQLNRLAITGLVRRTITLPDSLRLQVLTLTELIMDFRNRRDVAHLGTVDANEMDASFVINAANWIMAEMVRLEGQTSPDIAELEIKKIIERKMPIVEEIDGRLKVLNPNLNTKQKILVCLYQKFPQKIEDKELVMWMKDKNPARFRKYLKDLDKETFIDYTNSFAFLTRTGQVWIEKNIKFEIKI